MNILIKGLDTSHYLSVSLGDIINLPFFTYYSWKIHYIYGTSVSTFNMLEFEERVNLSKEGVILNDAEMKKLAENIIQLIDLHAVVYSDLPEQAIAEILLEDGQAWEIITEEISLYKQLSTLDGVVLR